MRFKNYFLALFLIGLLTGCKDNATEPNNTPQEIMPLKTGNTWNYKIFYTELNSATKIDAQKDYITTVGTESTMANEKWFSVINFIGKGSSGIFLQSKSDGLWAFGDGEKGMFFKYPAAVNSTFTNPAGTWTVVSTSAKVESGGKTYTCYQYKAPDFSEENSETNFYVAPGVGLIKSEFTATDTGTPYIVSQELQSYSLK